MKKIFVCLGICSECEIKKECPKSIQKKVKNKILEKMEMGTENVYHQKTCLEKKEVEEIAEVIEEKFSPKTLLENFKDDINNLTEILKIMKNAFSEQEIDNYIEKSLKNLFFSEKDITCEKMKIYLYYCSPELSITKIGEIVKNIKIFMEERIIHSIKKIKMKIKKGV